ncbi:hypothetical protein H5410_046896 [Solanum commersonii]|uniref:Uncharacterized protein n=1 Tax=Solanum commersonii TaxID=4109 RepID=A0A9J5XH26_SOLCO|nr:hypothetical protein H5410_046896 [Solanum commersonii]
MTELPSHPLLRLKTKLLTQTPKTQFKALETLPITLLAPTLRSRCDGNGKIPIRLSELKMLTDVNPIMNSQLKRNQITKNTPDRIGDHTNHSRNTNYE